MITPAFGLTATERVLPKLALDFTTASLDPRITFTRALNTATVVNSSGVIVGVNADIPRFDHDPVTLACKGLLIEEARTNWYTNSNAFTSGWLQNGFTANAIDISTSPISTGSKMLETATTTQHLIDYVNITGITSAATFTHSRFVRGGLGRDYIYLDLDDNAGNGGTCTINVATGQIISTANSGTGTNTTSSIQAWPDSWYRVSITTTFAAARTNARGIIGPFSDAGVTKTYLGDISKGLYVAGRQLEAGAFSTSYIPTTSAALTRNADVATMTGTNFNNSWYSSEGSAIVQTLPKLVNQTYPSIQFDDGTSNQIIALRGVSTDPQLYVVNGGSAQATLDAGTIAASTVYKLGGAWKVFDFATTLNGAAIVTQMSGSLPTVTQMRLGCDGINYLNGWLQNVRYWRLRLTNAQLQTFSV